MQRSSNLFTRIVPSVCRINASKFSTDKTVIPDVHTGKDLVAPPKTLPPTTKVDFPDDVVTVSGVPEEHVHGRKARIFVPARAATQSGWNNTKTWKVELDNRERWENPLMGWASSGDPLSNISGNMDFARKEDAIRFCIRQGWDYEVEEPQHLKIKAKAYGSNYAWNSKTKIWTK